MLQLYNKKANRQRMTNDDNQEEIKRMIQKKIDET